MDRVDSVLLIIFPMVVVSVSRVLDQLLLKHVLSINGGITCQQTLASAVPAF